MKLEFTRKELIQHFTDLVADCQNFIDVLEKKYGKYEINKTYNHEQCQVYDCILNEKHRIKKYGLIMNHLPSTDFIQIDTDEL